MKLKKIQLLGFKSFPELTVLDMSAPMVGIVGPNGCGKSNIVDAMRWVMGETSRHIRAATLEDVIFSGTNVRKPLGRASVEMFFDNSDGSIGGSYANYAELVIKRVVGRDSESKYYINNTHCRRRDITDIFFGTGLGTNSYAIIEQGMIIRIVEAKPEELRGYIEEAAGVSKYKERRRDTENRIRRTRDNLERVMDIRDEVDKQLRKLKRQVRDAEKFKQVRHEKSKLESELLLLKIRDHKQACSLHEKALSDHRVKLEQAQSEVRKYETEIEQQRAEMNTVSDERDAAKETGYRLDMEIATTEQDMDARNKNVEQMQQDQNDAKQALTNNTGETETQKTKQQELAREKEQLKQEIEHLKPVVIKLQEEHASVENTLNEIATLRNQYHSESRESSGMLEVEKARAEMHGKALAELVQNEQEIKRQIENLNIDDIRHKKDLDEVHLKECQEKLSKHQDQMNHTVAAIQALQKQVKATAEKLDLHRGEVQKKQAQASSLQVLQEARLGHDSDAFHEWIEKAGLTKDNLIAEKIEVADGWESAVEKVLESFLQGVQVGSIEQQMEKLDSFSHGDLVLIAPDADSNPLATSLASKVSGNLGLTGVLQHVKLADTLEQALSVQNSLLAYESVITKHGVWLGKNWVKLSKAATGDEGVLTRKHKIQQINSQIETLSQTITDLQQKLQANEQEMTDKEQLREHQQHEHATLLKGIANLEANAAHYQQSLKHQTLRQQELESASTEIQNKRQQLINERQQSQEQRVKAEQQVAAFNLQHSDIEKRQADASKRLAAVRSEMDIKQKSLHQAEIQKGSSHVAYEASIKQSEQLQQRMQELEQRLSTLAVMLKDLQSPLEEIKARHQSLVKQQFSERQKQEEINTRIAGLQKQSNILVQQHKQSEQRNEVLRNAYEQARTELEVSVARYNDLQQTFDNTDLKVSALELQDDTSVESHEAALQDIQRKIERMGAINLVALEEYNELSERHSYIETQHQDLVLALEILEKTISKIDNETKSRFKNTFDRINQYLQEMFPQLFNGGEAYLEMVDNDLLKTGVTIMAKPPGKRLSSINLMSGGEKALTAAAVVLAIFKLNPSPFCVLDEVDAPLDEHNVERFCQVLKSMSEQNQFIMITHNKSSMEYMDCLMGITMQEAGVSRLVSVDMEEATRLASA